MSGILVNCFILDLARELWVIKNILGKLDGLFFSAFDLLAREFLHRVGSLSQPEVCASKEINPCVRGKNLSGQMLESA